MAHSNAEKPCWKVQRESACRFNVSGPVRSPVESTVKPNRKMGIVSTVKQTDFFSRHLTTRMDSSGGVFIIGLLVGVVCSCVVIYVYYWRNIKPKLGLLDLSDNIKTCYHFSRIFDGDDDTVRPNRHLDEFDALTPQQQENVYNFVHDKSAYDTSQVPTAESVIYNAKSKSINKKEVRLVRYKGGTGGEGM